MSATSATPARVGGVGRHPTTDSVPDPAAPPPAPLIADILRTRRCLSGSVFLVEHIDDNIAVTNRYRTVRLLLGDGELCIQALLPGPMHPLVDSRAVFEGCYVKANKFELRYFDLAAPGRAEKKMAYLLVEDLTASGWSQQYLDMLAAPAAPEEEPAALLEPGGKDRRVAVEDDDVESGSDLDDVFEVMDVSVERATQRRREEQRRPERHTAPRPHWLASGDPTKPLKLTPLRSIPHLPYQQNWVVNVLVVVASLSDVEPSALPPHHQRRARLADPSTGKQVLLTVFLDPGDFVPSVGSVVLLIGLKNHRFDGGSLKKYASDRPRDGGRWWYEEPRHMEWCDVAGLRQWWESKDGIVAAAT